MNEVEIDDMDMSKVIPEMPSDQWVIRNGDSFIIQESVMPLVDWMDVRSGCFSLSFGTGSSPGSTFFFQKEEEAQRLYKELSQILGITMIQISKVEHVGFRPQQLSER